MAHSCDVPGHGHPVGPESRIAIDAGLADVLDALRAVNPAMVLEPMVCGYPPSPWWLMPTQALETFDITVLTPGEFRNMAVMAIGRGRWFLSTYFEPTRMKPEDWDFVAGLVRWARQNKELLVNAWQIGGRPEDREAYGYMFRNPTTDVYCVRNPWIEERSIELPASAIATEAREVRIIYPRRETVGRIGPGEPSRIRYYWDGVLRMPAVTEGELLVLVEGGSEVSEAVAEIMVGGRVTTVRKVTSAGQFAAATDASPENWTWFIVSVAPGETIFHLDLNIWSDAVSVGVYLRGLAPATNETAPETGAVFPTLRPDRRAWSQTLQPLRLLEVGSP